MLISPQGVAFAAPGGAIAGIMLMLRLIAGHKNWCIAWTVIVEAKYAVAAIAVEEVSPSPLSFSGHD